jgi:ABC-2 type transport system ATP-binding protein
MIEAEKLTKYYGDRAAVRDLSFEVKKGEIVGLLGPNGAGKTTTMRMLTGYLPIDGGRAVVAGYDVVEKPLEVRRRLGYLPETVPLYLEMPVRAYLDFTAKIRGVPAKGRRRRIEEVMELCRISDVSERVIGKLSRGYKQRVGLAQAIIHNPQVIILDEPTVGLDPRQIIEIRKVIRDLAGNHSMILSTHILPEVSALCDRVVIVNQGRVLVEDTLANLERQGASAERLRLEVRGPQPEIQEFLTRWPNVLQVERPSNQTSISIDSQGNLNPIVNPAEPAPPESASTDQEGPARFNLKITPNVDIREALAGAIIQQGWGLREIGLVIPSLEEIFVNMINEDLARQEEDEEEDTADFEELESEARPTGQTAVKIRPASDDDELDEPVVNEVIESEADLSSTEIIQRQGSTPGNARQRIYPVGKAQEHTGSKRKAVPSFLTASPKDRSSQGQAAGKEEALPGTETDQNSTESERE